MYIIKDLATAVLLCIDKISINCSIGKDNLSATCNLLEDLMITGQLPIQITKGRFYYYDCVILIETADVPQAQKVLLQVESLRPKASDIRIEFNPAKLGPLGIQQLREVLTSLGLDSIQILERGIVSRLDVALDIFDLTADQIVARSHGHRKHAVYSDRNGVPETLYFDTPRSNRTTIYTKNNTNGRVSLRLERRLKGPIPLGELARIENPFRTLWLISTQAIEPHLEGMVATHFFDSVRVRGFSHVVAELPSKKRKTLIAILREPQRSLLPSMDDFWAGWPDLVSAMFDPPNTHVPMSPRLSPADESQRAPQKS